MESYWRCVVCRSVFTNGVICIHHISLLSHTLVFAISFYFYVEQMAV